MAAEVLKLKARDELILHSEKDLGTKFSNLNEKQRSIATAKFYIREIHNPAGPSIADDELIEGIVDGKDDLGCDFIHRDDGRVIVVQTKYRSAATAEDAADITHFQSILKRFRDPSLKPNRHLREILADIDWETDTFELVFVSLGKISGQARTISSKSASYPDYITGLELRCDWNFLDEEDLNIRLRSARNLQRGGSDKWIQLFPVGEKGKRGAESVVEVDAGDYRSYIMALDAKQIIRCYTELDRDSIFSLNIRNFIGNTATNKNIVKSASEDTDNFFLYNNGISCLASSVKLYEDHLEVRGLQVINGAQTVKTLVNLERESSRQQKPLWANGRYPNALVRITEVPDGYGAGARVREKITQYNNTQNTIKISDFRSNDEVQNNLREQFHQLHRFGKKVSYLAKRTDKIPQNSEVVRLEEFAKSVYAFLFEPTAFSGSTSFLFTLEKGGGYVSVFGDGAKLWEKMPDDEFRLRAAAYWIAQEFARYIKQIRETEPDADSKAALERKWLLVFAAGCVFKEKFGQNNWRAKVEKLYSGNWRIDDGKDGELVKRVFELAKAGVVNAYKNAKKYNPNFVHRNWMRSKNTPADIADTLKDSVLPLARSLE